MNLNLPTPQVGGLYVPQMQLPLVTRRGTQIRNGVGVEPEENGRRQYAAERQLHPSWDNRRPANGEYNCWGMAFANRRTGIYDDDVVELVLTEDGYREVVDYGNDVKPSDLIVYRFKSNRSFAHVGLIVRFRMSGGAPEAVILSKWNIGYGEDFHGIDDVVDFLRGTYVWEIWTDRPLATAPRASLITTVVR